MKNRKSEVNGENERNNFSGPKSVDMKTKKKKKKNMQRLGGGGLSLESFANAKSTTTGYNPAIIKQKREFYKNAKCVSKYKKSLQRESQKKQEGDNEGSHRNKAAKRNKICKKGSNSLNILYEKQREEKEKARMEREAIIQAKKEEKEKSQAQRKTARENMLKRTRHGQPVMKYRIEHLLQSLQSSTSKSVNKSA